MQQREKALARRHARREAELTEHTRVLKPLAVGQVVLVQNQMGNSPRRWDKSGTIVEVRDFDQYKVKLDGTGRLSLRNRRFLKPIVPYAGMVQGSNQNVTDTGNSLSSGDQLLGGPGDEESRRLSVRVRRPPERLQVSVISDIGSRSSQGEGRSGVHSHKGGMQAAGPTWSL